MASLGIGLLLWRISYRFTNPADYQFKGPAVGQATHDFDPNTEADPRAACGLEFEDVEFPSADGATLRGWFVPVPGSQLAIVATHGRGADRRAYLPQLGLLHDLGATVLLFDFREHGTSDGTGRGMSAGYREAQDISAAARYLKHQVGVDHVVVIGSSLGGVAAILAAADDRSINAVITEGAFSSAEAYLFESGAEGLADSSPLMAWLLKRPWWPRAVVALTAWREGIPGVPAAGDAIARLSPMPILIMHGLADRSIQPSEAERLFRRAGEPKELWLVSGARHGEAFSRDPGEYQRRVTSFLDQQRLLPVGRSGGVRLADGLAPDSPFE